MRPSAIITVLLVTAVASAEPTRYTAHDTLVAPPDPSPETAELLRAAGYEAAEFEVTVSPPAEGESGDMIVRFPSPRPDPTAGPAVNTVPLEWYIARRDGAPLRKAPAVLVLHTLDRRLHVSQGIARVLASEGVHAFVMHSPGYGQRGYEPYRAFGDRFFERSAQSIADARRARDAIAALPAVPADRISVQGTSLGGFQAIVAASMDGAFEHNFIFLAGADLCGVLTDGVREAQWIRDSLRRNGVGDEELKKLCRPIEPLRNARNLDPKRTWLFSAKEDQVVPAPNAKSLAHAIGLEESHHIWLSGDHYGALLHTEWMSHRIAATVTGSP